MSIEGKRRLSAYSLEKMIIRRAIKAEEKVKEAERELALVNRLGRKKKSRLLKMGVTLRKAIRAEVKRKGRKLSGRYLMRRRLTTLHSGNKKIEPHEHNFTSQLKDRNETADFDNVFSN